MTRPGFRRAQYLYTLAITKVAAALTISDPPYYRIAQLD